MPSHFLKLAELILPVFEDLSSSNTCLLICSSSSSVGSSSSSSSPFLSDAIPAASSMTFTSCQKFSNEMSLSFPIISVTRRSTVEDCNKPESTKSLTSSHSLNFFNERVFADPFNSLYKSLTVSSSTSSSPSVPPSMITSSPSSMVSLSSSSTSPSFIADVVSSIICNKLENCSSVNWPFILAPTSDTRIRIVSISIKSLLSNSSISSQARKSFTASFFFLGSLLSSSNISDVASSFDITSSSSLEVAVIALSLADGGVSSLLSSSPSELISRTTAMN
mmetsp:Transcript_22297/g.30680  ORF Transcript_22297/g.30680 Transcript_22297/m.30680 type:complete len:278 (-) Transcript_22297:32-865(-)